MQTASRRWTTWAIAASALAHVAVLIAGLLQRPSLPPLAQEAAGPPEAIIPVLILPRTRLAEGAGFKPAPIQLHQRRLRAPLEPSPAPPVVVAPPKPVEAPAQTPGPVTAKETPPPAPSSDAVRAVLRTTLGCTDMRLSREDRTGCLERLGRGARDAPYFAQPLSGEKRAAFDHAGAAKLAARAALESPLARPGPPQPADYSGAPYTSGAGESILGPVVFPPSKRAAPKLGPLPP